jgi:hypothetical protein
MMVRFLSTGRRVLDTRSIQLANPVTSATTDTWRTNGDVGE